MTEVTERELNNLDQFMTFVMNQGASCVRVDSHVLRRLLDDSRDLHRIEPHYRRVCAGLERVVDLGTSPQDDGTGCAQLARRLLEGRET